MGLTGIARRPSDARYACAMRRMPTLPQPVGQCHWLGRTLAGSRITPASPPAAVPALLDLGVGLEPGWELWLERTFALEQEEVHAVAEGGAEVGAVLHQVAGQALPVEAAHCAGTAGAKVAQCELGPGGSCPRGQGPAPAGHCQLAEPSPSKWLRHPTLTAGLLSLHLLAGRPALTCPGWQTLHLEELSARLLYGTVSLLIYTFTRPRARPRCEASAALCVHGETLLLTRWT